MIGMRWTKNGTSTRYRQGKFVVQAYELGDHVSLFLHKRGSERVLDTGRVKNEREATTWAQQRLGERNSECAWFLGCHNPATGGREHPILGRVPICARCDEKVRYL